MVLRRLCVLVFLICSTAFLNFAKAESQSIHIVVALCDNVHQGIAPVKAKIGNGKNPTDNLYWGAYFGVKSSFERNASWKLVKSLKYPEKNILERIVFKHISKDIYLIADAYDGEQIRSAIDDYLKVCAGVLHKSVQVQGKQIEFGGISNLVAYVGHNGLIEYQPNTFPSGNHSNEKLAITLGCYSKRYFEEAIKTAGAYPLIWTTGSMAPEAYILEGAIKGWINRESFSQIQQRAAKAYSQYQKCSLSSSNELLVSGW